MPIPTVELEHHVVLDCIGPSMKQDSAAAAATVGYRQRHRAQMYSWA